MHKIYSKLPSDMITEDCIRHWFNYFRLNTVYEKYCYAKRAKKNIDIAVCKTIEGEFPKIAELYDDWGDIHTFPIAESVQSAGWKKWFECRRDLFIVSPIELLSLPIDEMEPGSTAITIPVGISKQLMQSMFDDFLERNPVVIGDRPKYKLNLIPFKTLVNTSISLDDIDMISADFSRDGSRKASHAEIAATIISMKEVSDISFQWYPTKEQKQALSQGKSILTSVAIQARTIKNLEKIYFNSIDGTINGIFPSTR